MLYAEGWLWEPDTERLRHIGSHAAVYADRTGSRWFALSRLGGQVVSDGARIAKFTDLQDALAAALAAA